MSGINPISGGLPPIQSPLGGGGAGEAKSSPQRLSFGEMLQGAVGNVQKDQQASAGAIQDLLAGRTEDVLPVVSAAAKADLSFKLLIGVRNKVIEAYKQTMNMQV